MASAAGVSAIVHRKVAGVKIGAPMVRPRGMGQIADRATGSIANDHPGRTVRPERVRRMGRQVGRAGHRTIDFDPAGHHQAISRRRRTASSPFSF